MTIEQQQHDENEKHPPQELADKTTFAGESRRRFTKSGLAASGVLLTLSSRSVLGAAKINTSPSGFVSANQSGHGAAAAQLSQGQSPGYWKKHSGWPVADTTLFDYTFGCKPGSPYKDCTLKDVLSTQFHDQNLARHLVAAYLNALSGWTPFLSASVVVNMFTEWQANGVFFPMANADGWDACKIVTYIKGTYVDTAEPPSC